MRMKNLFLVGFLDLGVIYSENIFGVRRSPPKIMYIISTSLNLLERHDAHVQAELLNAAVCLRIFIYKGPTTKLGSRCRADRAQSNGPTLSSLANFPIELEQFCCSITAA